MRRATAQKWNQQIAVQQDCLIRQWYSSIVPTSTTTNKGNPRLMPAEYAGFSIFYPPYVAIRQYSNPGDFSMASYHHLFIKEKQIFSGG
jgi:hypothetical protein